MALRVDVEYSANVTQNAEVSMNHYHNLFLSVTSSANATCAKTSVCCIKIERNYYVNDSFQAYNYNLSLSISLEKEI